MDTALGYIPRMKWMGCASALTVEACVPIASFILCMNVSVTNTF